MVGTRRPFKCYLIVILGRKRKRPTFSEEIRFPTCGKKGCGATCTLGVLLRGGSELGAAQPPLALNCSLCVVVCKVTSVSRAGCLERRSGALKRARFRSGSLMCVRDVILMCEVVCGSQQNEEALCWSAAAAMPRFLGRRGKRPHTQEQPPPPPPVWTPSSSLFSSSSVRSR